MYNYEASFFVWLTEPLYLTKFQKAAICVRDFQGVRDATLTFRQVSSLTQRQKNIMKLQRNCTRANITRIPPGNAKSDG